MPLSPGTAIGAYEVVSPLGVGGMGEVYRARDRRLKRDVAIKVLPEAVSGDPDRLSRFQREAEILAALNHPNIAAIYGIEKANAGTAIVLEFVDGETLAEIIGRGAMSTADALPIARAIAEALEAAHERGIVHRDLKPANVKITTEGKVKVLDFGLAKAVEGTGQLGLSGPGGSKEQVPLYGVTQSPTITTPAVTMAGVILGTAAYMSPEQARGKPVDRRTDIWAFGCVLYEMLTGRRTFEAGETVSDAIAAILKQDPDWTALPPDTPPHIRTLLKRCLQKEPQKRLPHIGVARLEIDETLRDAEQPQSASAPVAHSSRWRLAPTAIGILLVAAVTVWMSSRGERLAPPMYVDVAIPSASSAVAAISPDGRRIVFAAFSEAGRQLWIRSLDSQIPRPLPHTERGQFPFWSPDSRSIAFYVEGLLKRLDVDSGTVQTLTKSLPNGGAWNRDGVILIGSPTGQILRLSDQGGEPTPVGTADEKRRPTRRVLEFLPDQKHFLYFQVVGPRDEERGIYVSDLAGSEARLVVPIAEGAAYAPSGHLFFVRDTALMAQKFDPDTQSVSGNPMVVADPVMANTLSVSAAGPILYRTGGDRRIRTFSWVDRSGNERSIGTIAGVESWSLAPNERQVAIQRLQNQNVDIWTYDLERAAYTRLTINEGLDLAPIWSPDSLRITFSSPRQPGRADLYDKTVGGAAPESVLLETSASKRPNDWSRDGRFLLYEEAHPQNRGDLWVLPTQGHREPFPVVQTPFEDTGGQFSPDGNWIAYQSDETGQREIYAQKFPDGSGKVLVSMDGGTQVRWGADGKELFYIDPVDRLMSVPLSYTGSGASLVPGKAVPLFRTRIPGGVAQTGALPSYAVARDGRFLMGTFPEEFITAPLRMILNWRPPADGGN